MKQLITILLAVITAMPVTAQSDKHYLLVGTYTSSGKSKGVYVFKFNSNTGDAVIVDSIATTNPSFLCLSPDEKYVYAVHEVDRSGKGGEVSSFRLTKKTGALQLINTQSSGGDHPCYVQADKTGKWLLVANYSSGSLSVLPIGKKGVLGKATTQIQQTGSGPNKDRQDKPHVHCTVISPDNRWLYVCDLGTDKIMIYAFNAHTGQLTPANPPFYSTTPGAGPRHFTFHPDGRYAYLIEELGGHVLAFEYNTGQLSAIQRLPTMEDGQIGYPGSADIHVSEDGNFLYATNRGDLNSIASYKIGSDGRLTPIGYQSVLGKAPRNFNVDPSGNFLLVANQDSDEIVIFKRDKQTGALTDTGKRIAVGMPVCLKWAKIN